MIFLKKLILSKSPPGFVRRVLPYTKVLFRGDPLFFFPTEKKVCFLTIDDAPSYDRSKNDDLLTILKNNEVKATFFIISSHIEEKHHSFLDSLISQGNELANHLKINEPAHNYTQERFENDLLECEYILNKFSKKKEQDVKLFRPPYGKISKNMNTVLKKHKYKIILGDLYSYDYYIKDPHFHSNYILKNMKEGSIIILHFPEKERNYQTLQILEKIIPSLKSEGYEFQLIGQFIKDLQIK